MKMLEGKVILIVDDEELLREVIMELFSNQGATVVGAENGTRAFAMVQSRHFDAVITDVRMAGGDGLTLLKNINDTMAVVPKVFLCTGFSDLTKENAKVLGVVDVFTKPFDPHWLIQAVSEALGAAATKS